jgi:LmbE family N-acetylglucosaminyl deacetylase
LGKKIKIITVFTKASGKTISPQAKSFLSVCGYKNAKKLFEDREGEDRSAAKYLGINVMHLGFIDAAWRIGKNKKPIYSGEKSQFCGRVSSRDGILTKKILHKLDSLIKKQKGKFILLAPLSVGGHADHAIIQRIVYRLRYPKLFWEDFPYNTKRESLKKFFAGSKEFRSIFRLRSFSHSEKEKAIRLYKSQTGSLFPSGKIPYVSENYYIQKNSEPL